MLRGTAIWLGALMLALLGAGCGGQAARPRTSLELSARMTPGQVVTPTGRPWHVPRAARAAQGSLSATVSGDGRSLRWRLTFANLGRPRIIEADIHVGAAGQFGAILVHLCSYCVSGKSRVATLRPGAAAELASSGHWVTVITDRYPNGIVRGQITARRPR